MDPNRARGYRALLCFLLVCCLIGLLYWLVSTQPQNAFALSLAVIGGICALFVFYVYIEFTYFHHTKELSGIEYHQPANVAAAMEPKKEGEVLL